MTTGKANLPVVKAVLSAGGGMHSAGDGGFTVKKGLRPGADRMVQRLDTLQDYAALKTRQERYSVDVRDLRRARVFPAGPRHRAGLRGILARMDLVRALRQD